MGGPDDLEIDLQKMQEAIDKAKAEEDAQKIRDALEEGK